MAMALRHAKNVASSTSQLDRIATSRDVWPRDVLGVRDHFTRPVPERVFWPATDAEVASILQDAAELGKRVVPYGAGSGVCGGARADQGVWMLDLKRFDKIGKVNTGDWTVEAGAGVIGQVLEDHLAAQGWSNGHSPSSIGCSTVGGWVAARSAGQLSSAYGVFDDRLLGVDAVFPARGAVCLGLAGANSPPIQGDDRWLDWLTGSEGRLGVITRVRMRVHPSPGHRVLRGWWMPDVPTALTVMRKLMQADLWPAVLRLYDPVDTLIGGKTRPKSKASAHRNRQWFRSLLARVERDPKLRHATLAMPLSIPRLLQRIADGLSGGCLLIVGWEGESTLAQMRFDAAQPILAAHGRDLGAEPGERWWASRHAVSYKLMPIVLHGGFVDTMEVAAPWSQLPAVYAEVKRALRPYALTMAHFSHAYPEGGCIYLSMAGRGDLAVYDAAWRAALKAATGLGASVSHHHGIGRLKAAAATDAMGPAADNMRRLCREFDPDGVLARDALILSTAPQGNVKAMTTQPTDALTELAADLAPCSLVDPPARWPWDRAGIPPRLARNAWESSWISVRGKIGQDDVCIGRGPREAIGPDLRALIAGSALSAKVTIATATPDSCWMGRVQVAHPWAVLRDVLRCGLRPNQFGVEGGQLYIGFRGPAASQYGEMLLTQLDLQMEPCAWRVLFRYAGPVTPCDALDDRAVGATEQHVFRAADEGDVQDG